MGSSGVQYPLPSSMEPVSLYLRDHTSLDTILSSNMVNTLDSNTTSILTRPVLHGLIAVANDPS